MLKYLSAAVLTGLALTVTGAALAADVHAAPAPGSPTELALRARLAIAGADRGDAVVLGERVCAILGADPTPAGKLAARTYLRNAGVEAGFREGWTLGTVVDVMCPALVPVLR